MPDVLIRTLLHRVSQPEAQVPSNVEQVQPVPSPLAMSHPVQPQDYGNDAGIPDLAQSVISEPENSLNTENPKSVVPEDDRRCLSSLPGVETKMPRLEVQ